MAGARRDSQILVVIGATASGKRALALDLARALTRTTDAVESLTVDSRQVYREMNIGTAKPTAAERAEVRHHLIDIVDPNETFTVAQFVELAERVIRDARPRGATLIVTGGTPLYFKSLFEG